MLPPTTYTQQIIQRNLFSSYFIGVGPANITEPQPLADEGAQAKAIIRVALREDAKWEPEPTTLNSKL
jgi:hypothetical protein